MDNLGKDSANESGQAIQQPSPGPNPAGGAEGMAAPLPKEPNDKAKKPFNVWKLACIIAIVALAGSFLINVILAVYAGGKSISSAGGKVFDNQSTSFVMGDKGSPSKILEIRVNGTILNDGSDNVKKNIVARMLNELDYAEREDSVKGVIMTINSPGGGITATDIIWKRIKDFKEKTKKPIVVYCEEMAASGGYYLASKGDYIIATETSLVGSIGVISQFMDMEQLFKKIGVRWTTITSKRFDGKKSYKDMGSFAREMTPEERAFFQELVQEMWDKFVNVVAEGRKGKLTREQVARLADGRVYTGKKALKLKLVDGIGYKQDAFEKAKQLTGLKSAQMVTCSYPSSYFEGFMSSKSEKGLLPSAKEMIEEQTPRFMYLWTGRN